MADKKSKIKKTKSKPTKREYILAQNYKCAMAAYEDQDGASGWVFSLELLTDKNKLIDINGSRKYASFQDAILDCYGVVEYLGFSIEGRMRVEVAVHHWEKEKKKYLEKKIYFDGLDFYKNEKTQ